jgi:hypothetical protein
MPWDSRLCGGGERGRSCGKEEQCLGGDLLHLLTLTGWHSPVFDVRASKEVLMGAVKRTKDDR